MRCCGAATCPPGLPGAVGPKLPFPCSAVLWGQEALHCKAAFQDFLQQSRMRLRTGSRGTCSPQGCWGHPPAAPAQVTSMAMPRAWGSSYGTKRGLAMRWEHRSLLLTLTQHHSSHLGLKEWRKGGTGIPWVMCGESQGGGDVTLSQASMHICSSFFRKRRRIKAIHHWGTNWGHLLNISPGLGHHSTQRGALFPVAVAAHPLLPQRPQHGGDSPR